MRKNTILNQVLQLFSRYEFKTDFERRYCESLEIASASRMPPLDESEMADGIANDFEAIKIQIDCING